ncbi:MBL fold metallo-hydrolase [Roseibium salinum]|nr:MBL fold metallo-hydrolase [Roseibium salinum]
MVPQYEILVEGSSVAFQGGFFGISTIVLIRSGATLALFDCGHGVTRKLLLDALQHRGLAPKDIDLVILSHGHFDHVLNLDLFFLKSRSSSAATNTITSRRPSRATGSHRASCPCCSKAANCASPRARKKFCPVLPPSRPPGHAPGHISLELPSPEGPVVLAADALKTAREASTGIPDLEFDPEKNAARNRYRTSCVAAASSFPAISRRSGRTRTAGSHGPAFRRCHCCSGERGLDG